MVSLATTEGADGVKKNATREKRGLVSSPKVWLRMGGAHHLAGLVGSFGLYRSYYPGLPRMAASLEYDMVYSLYPCS